MTNNKKSHHVVYNNNSDQWSVKRSGAQRSSGNFNTKNQAIAAAREISRNQGTELFIHNMDGKFRQKDSHGKDPLLIKG